jgi:hypothetical protein
MTMTWLKARGKMQKPPLAWRLKWFLVLIFMMIIDLGPIPFSATLLMFVFIFRPIWFRTVIDKLYTGKW